MTGDLILRARAEMQPIDARARLAAAGFARRSVGDVQRRATIARAGRLDARGACSIGTLDSGNRAIGAIASGLG